MKKLYHKFRNLVFIRNHYGEYREVLKTAKSAGYTFYTLLEYVRLRRLDKSAVKTPFIILRHDIDTDIRGALIFAGIENKLGIKATYFFRWKSWNDNIIQQLFLAGHEIGYHNEEVADYAARHQIREAGQINNHISAIRQLFEQRLQSLRQKSNLKLSGIASHGHYINHVLDIGNFVILDDENYRKQMGIEYEAYDDELFNSYETHLSDKPWPELFRPAHPLNYITDGKSFLFLTHPRWWRRNVLSNLREELNGAIKKAQWQRKK